eukprot:1035386-Pyramimonas_sp.AAC.1
MPSPTSQAPQRRMKLPRSRTWARRAFFKNARLPPAKINRTSKGGLSPGCTRTSNNHENH